MDSNFQPACAHADPRLFEPIGVRGASRQRHIAQAKSWCHGCPVQAKCLEEALAQGDMCTVRGGAAPEEREAILRARHRGKEVARAA